MRPPIWAVQLVLETLCVEHSAECMFAIEMRSIFHSPEKAIFEFRGGTHLLIFPKGKSARLRGVV